LDAGAVAVVAWRVETFVWQPLSQWAWPSPRSPRRVVAPQPNLAIGSERRLADRGRVRWLAIFGRNPREFCDAAAARPSQRGSRLRCL